MRTPWPREGCAADRCVTHAPAVPRPWTQRLGLARGPIGGRGVAKNRPLSYFFAELFRAGGNAALSGGWSAIGEWTGVPLSHVLQQAGMKQEARYVHFECEDDHWYDTIDMFDALHAQTILAYGMNGGDLPVKHGAPVRLRVERQLGYKSTKFVKRITVVDSLDKIKDGKISTAIDFNFAWYGGI